MKTMRIIGAVVGSLFAIVVAAFIYEDFYIRIPAALREYQPQTANVASVKADAGYVLVEFDNHVCVVGGETKDLLLTTSVGTLKLAHPHAAPSLPCEPSRQSTELKFRIPDEHLNKRIDVFRMGKKNARLEVLTPSGDLARTRFSQTSVESKGMNRVPANRASVTGVKGTKDGYIAVEFDNRVCVVGGETEDLVLFTSRGRSPLVIPFAHPRYPCPKINQSMELLFKLPTTNSRIEVRGMGSTNSRIDILTPSGNLAWTSFSTTVVCVPKSPEDDQCDAAYAAYAASLPDTANVTRVYASGSYIRVDFDNPVCVVGDGDAKDLVLNTSLGRMGLAWNRHTVAPTSPCPLDDRTRNLSFSIPDKHRSQRIDVYNLSGVNESVKALTLAGTPANVEFSRISVCSPRHSKDDRCDRVLPGWRR